MRPGCKRNAQHVRRRRHLEIQGLGDFVLKPRHVRIADVTAVLAQMRRNTVGPRLDRQQRRAHGIWSESTPRITQGRDMIDIDAEAKRDERLSHLQTRVELKTTRSSQKARRVQKRECKGIALF